MVGPGEALQAEVYGEGIQANPLKVRGVHTAVFGLWRGRRLLSMADWPEAVRALGAPVMPDVHLGASVAEMVAQANGLRSVVSPAQLAEGIVWHSADGRVFPELDGRASFKVVSNAWLLKHGG